MTGCTDDDLRVLIAKGFVICFESGVLVITDWKLHNYIPTDRYHKTLYQKELEQLEIENGVYSLKHSGETDTPCIQACLQDVYTLDTEERLGKERLGKAKGEILSPVGDPQPRFDYQAVVDSFNSVCKSLPIFIIQPKLS